MANENSLPELEDIPRNSILEYMARVLEMVSFLQISSLLVSACLFDCPGLPNKYVFNLVQEFAGGMEQSAVNESIFRMNRQSKTYVVVIETSISV
jgi:hypothetical protein